MAIGRKLTNISVSAQAGRIGVSFAFDSGPNEHILLPPVVAEKLIEQLTAAREALKHPQTPGDGVSVSDHCSVAIV